MKGFETFKTPENPKNPRDLERNIDDEGDYVEYDNDRLAEGLGELNETQAADLRKYLRSIDAPNVAPDSKKKDN